MLCWIFGWIKFRDECKYIELWLNNKTWVLSHRKCDNEATVWEGNFLMFYGGNYSWLFPGVKFSVQYTFKCPLEQIFNNSEVYKAIVYMWVYCDYFREDCVYLET